jgi:hypothetical protein
MNLLENVKRITEKATGWKRPDDPQDLLRKRKPLTYRFTDDGLIPITPNGHSSYIRARSAGRTISTPLLSSRICLNVTAGEIRGATALTITLTTTRAFTKCLVSRAAAAAYSAAAKDARLSWKRATLRSCPLVQDINALKRATIFW